MTPKFQIKKLSTKRLILRAFTQGDFEFLKGHFQNEGVTEFLYDMEPPKSDKDVQGVLDWCTNNSEDHIRWAIALKNDPENLIGTCGFHCHDAQNNAVEIGYDLSNIHWRNGYMSEALEAVIKYGFKELHIHRISAYVYPNNAASSALLKKLGFALEGTVRDKHLFRGKYYDHDLYSLLNTQ